MVETRAAAEVLILGTFHMANPGRDVINFVADDVLAPHRQQELEDIAERLAAFAPTKICVERAPEHQAKVDEAFARYLADETDPNPDEIQQVAFRLAKRCGLAGVHGVDDHEPMVWSGLEAYLATHPEEMARWESDLSAMQQRFDAEAEVLARTPLGEYLLKTNEESALREDLAWYVDLGGLGGLGEHGGAEMVTSWYGRNIRIFSNLCAVTEPGDRIFVLIGAGHVPILRQLVEVSTRHRLVEVAQHL